MIKKSKSQKITKSKENSQNPSHIDDDLFDEFKYVSINKTQPKKQKKTKKKTILEFEENSEQSEKNDVQKTEINKKKIKNSSKDQDQQEEQVGEAKKRGKNKSLEKETKQKETAKKSPRKSKKGYNTKENYEEMIKIVEEIRKNKDAAVDTQGAGMQADPTQPIPIQHWQVLTSLLLSVQTKDETTDMVMKRLVAEQFSVDKALEMTDEQLKEKIFEVNFNGKKVTYIKKCAEIIKKDYNGSIPNSYNTIIKWPGVGPKIANLFMQIAYDQVVGISVDTHVNRISNRLGWVQTSTPEQTKQALEKFLDKKYWRTINPLLVGLGQTICKPQNPDCKNCLLNDKCEEGRRRMVGRKKI